MLASGQLTSSVARPEKHPHEHYRAINTLFSLALALLSLPSPSPLSFVVFYTSESGLLQAQYNDGSLHTH